MICSHWFFGWMRILVEEAAAPFAFIIYFLGRAAELCRLLHACPRLIFNQGTLVRPEDLRWLNSLSYWSHAYLLMVYNDQSLLITSVINEKIQRCDFGNSSTFSPYFLTVTQLDVRIHESAKFIIASVSSLPVCLSVSLALALSLSLFLFHSSTYSLFTPQAKSEVAILINLPASLQLTSGQPHRKLHSLLLHQAGETESEGGKQRKVGRG